MTTTTAHAAGTFEVKLAPQTDEVGGAPSPVGRMTIEKRFSGALDAVSRGQMVAFSSSVQGSAGYVAMEHVTGTLHGKRGTFALQHSGTMTRGAPELVVTVVPDSGTDELVGLTGRMAIVVAGGAHSYEFTYAL